MIQLAPSISINEIILEQANKCVLCGLCLPECPTFNETHREAQSPRGRIAFAKALAENKLPPSDTLLASLAGCLHCRACEQSCPSKVGYRTMIMATYSLLASSPGSKKKSRSILLRLIVHLARTPKFFSFLVTAYQKSGLRWILKKSNLLKLLGLNYVDRLLPEHKSPTIRRHVTGTHTKQGNRVGLFTGCLGQVFDKQTLDSARLVFEALGIELVTAGQPLCCGGLHKSDPHWKNEHDISTSFPPDIKTIVSCISGCTAEFVENQISVKTIVDISGFLGQQDFKNIKLKPYTGTIGVHEPCSLRYPLETQAAAYKILQNIPGANILALPENNRCCGGAGDFLFRQPAMAKKLAENKLLAMEQMQDPAPDIIVTSNLGCALNLQAGLNDQGKNIEVIHPVTLLARQLSGLA